MTISTVDVAALADELSRNIHGEVRFDNGSRALYATDASNYRQVPIGVVIPKSVDDVIATVAACSRHGAPIVSRGGGTSLAGQCCNVAVVIDMSKYLTRILELNPDNKTARVEPGCVLDDLRDAAEKHHLTFAPDPSTHSHNTLGGMIGNNSCGVHSVMGGKTVDNVIELDVLLYDGTRLKVGQTDIKEFERIVAEGGRRGEIYARLKALCDQQADRIRSRYPKIPRRVSGYNLDELLPENGFNVARALVGTEGTCVVILEATLRLVDSPPARSLLVLGYSDVFGAGDHVPEVLKHKPIGLEGIDDCLVADMKAINLHPEDIQLLPEGGGWLLAEFGGNNKNESDALATACMDALQQSGNPPTMKLFDKPEEEKMIWKVRESGLGATAHVPNKKITWEGWEDAAVPPDKVGDYLRDFRKLLEKFGYECDLYGHFGQGCIHTRIDFDLETDAGIQTFHAFLNE
ncbi:MAG: FAD-binding oxidoreductase, partial [Methylobacter sp.]